MVGHLKPKTIHSITALPEIMALITRFLTIQEIANSMLTCKALRQDFTPFFWENIDLKTTPYESESIHENLHLIRYINAAEKKVPFLKILTNGLPPIDSLSQVDEKTVPKTTSLCTNLLHLKFFYWHEYCRSLQQMNTLLYHNTNLTVLEFHIGTLEDKSDFPAFLEILPSLQHLRRFSCHSLFFIPFQLVISLFQVTLSLPRLSEIYYNILVRVDEGETITKDVGTVLKEAMTARAQFGGQAQTRIKSIQIPEAENVFTFLVPFLKSGLLGLDTLEIPWSNASFLTEQLALVKKYCPNISNVTFLRGKHYTYPIGMGVYPIQDEARIINSIYTFIQGCTSLKSVTLRGLCADKRPATTVNLLSELRDRHTDSLEQFEFYHCGGDRYEVLHAAIPLLFHCRNLKRHWVIPADPVVHGFLLKDLVADEWVCHGLRELSLVLYRGSEGKSYYSRSEINTSVTIDTVNLKELFTRINKLEHLEVLALKEDESKLSKECMEEWGKALSENFLMLSNMKRLRHFHMMSDFSSWMGVEHVKLMDQHWPMLQSISFNVWYCYDGWLQRYLEGKPYWQWLKERRSNLYYEEFSEKAMNKHLDIPH